ncbi:MAG: phytoene/squalene synthase family protein [Acidobacteriaceae bacterium]
MSDIRITAPCTPGPQIAEAYRLCRELARREAKNFYWAFRVLPRHKSDAMCAVYAFMRRADDISDDESKSLDSRRAEMSAWLQSWRNSRTPAPTPTPTSPTTTPPTPDNPIFLALADTQRRFSIPDALLEELVAGTAMDLEPRPNPSDQNEPQTYPTFDDLYRYCYLVASVVGLVSIRIFGYTDPRAEALAEETGIAFQLTNILRDVKEDAERNRIYIPLDLMDEFGESIPELHELAAGRPMTERERAMLATLAIRAEKYYVAAGKLIPLLDRDSRAAMGVLVAIYHSLLARIAAHRMDVFTNRVAVPTPTKLAILARGALITAWNRILG